MNEIFESVLIQALYYGLWGFICIMFCAVLQRGFFYNYLKVRTSFGKLVMVKVRSPLRDYFCRGEVIEGFLVYKIKRGFRDYDTIRLNLPQNGQVFYRCLSVSWIDVDDEKHAISQTDYTVVSGYDAVKNNNLHTRALMKPSISSGQEKLILFLIVVVGLLCLVACYFAYMSNANVTALMQNLPEMLKNMTGTVTGGAKI